MVWKIMTGTIQILAVITVTMTITSIIKLIEKKIQVTLELKTEPQRVLPLSLPTDCVIVSVAARGSFSQLEPGGPSTGEEGGGGAALGQGQRVGRGLTGLCVSTQVYMFVYECIYVCVYFLCVRESIKKECVILSFGFIRT